VEGLRNENESRKGNEGMAEADAEWRRGYTRDQNLSGLYFNREDESIKGTAFDVSSG
jgi:hypothetical protein